MKGEERKAKAKRGAQASSSVIRRGRGIARRKPGEPPMSRWWSDHKRREKDLEDRHAR